MATKPELNKAIAYEKIKANKWNENFDTILDYIEEVSDELTLKLNTINSQLSSSILSNLQSVYPVGSLYIGITDNCPIANLFGTWEKVSEGRVLQGADGSQKVGSTVEAGLPNITGFTAGFPYGASNCFSRYPDRNGTNGPNGAFYPAGYARVGSNDGREGTSVAFDASRSSDIYKNDCNTVQPPAYLVNIWKRTA